MPFIKQNLSGNLSGRTVCTHREFRKCSLGYRQTWSTARVRHCLPQGGQGKGSGLLRGFLGIDY